MEEATATIVESSCDSNCYYGFLAAFISCLGFGSFAVPMKSEAAKAVDIDPLVFQSYKTFWCLATSFLVIPLGNPFKFTPWGIVSGFFWVPAGVAHVCGVRTAGIAIATATLSSIIVLVSFSWGIFFFHERVKSLESACLAIVLIVGGICGMSQYSSLGSSSTSSSSESKDIEMSAKVSSPKRGKAEDVHPLISSSTNSSEEKKSSIISDKLLSNNDNDDIDDKNRKKSHIMGPEAFITQLSDYINRKYNLRTTYRQLGVCCSAFAGVWGGSIMVPLQFSSVETKGLGFVISFALGATTVTLCFWMLRFMYLFMAHQRSFYQAYHALPGFHFHCMCVPGSIAGILWSIGNIGSILSVTYLGEGIGYSVTQSSMLISGLWGIFWFREITTSHAIRMWILMAIITLTGILLLSYNHVGNDLE